MTSTTSTQSIEETIAYEYGEIINTTLVPQLRNLTGLESEVTVTVTPTVTVTEKGDYNIDLGLNLTFGDTNQVYLEEEVRRRLFTELLNRLLSRTLNQ